MTGRTAAIGGAVVTLTLAGSATAAFIELTLEEYVGDGWVENGYAGLTTYRLFAHFDQSDPDDGVISVFGTAPYGPLSLHSTDGAFFNSLAEGNNNTLAPEDLTAMGIWEPQWDTYVTIKATSADGNATAVDPNFNNDTKDLGVNWTLSNNGWFVTPDDGSFFPREVILGQFTVAEGERVSGVLNLAIRSAPEPITQLAFPAPGALALLVVAGVRRRRRST